MGGPRPPHLRNPGPRLHPQGPRVHRLARLAGHAGVAPRHPAHLVPGHAGVPLDGGIAPAPRLSAQVAAARHGALPGAAARGVGRRGRKPRARPRAPAARPPAGAALPGGEVRVEADVSAAREHAARAQRVRRVRRHVSGLLPLGRLRHGAGRSGPAGLEHRLGSALQRLRGETDVSAFLETGQTPTDPLDSAPRATTSSSSARLSNACATRWPS